MTDDHNISRIFLETARSQPGQVALIQKTAFGSRSLTFAELEQRTLACAAALRNGGISKGDRIILMVKPSPEFIALTFALFSLGAVVILIDPGMGYKNLLKCIGAVQPDGFIGIPKAHIFKKIFPKPFSTVKVDICVGPSLGFLGRSLSSLLGKTGTQDVEPVRSQGDELAAIIFTTGSTGPPKGVQYLHSIFRAQLGLIRDFYGIKAGEIDQPAFPLFALFSMALGATAVIPVMDPSRPAKVNPAKFVQTIQEHQVTYSFGSPTIWQVVSRYCLNEKITLPTLKKVLMAGAPVPGDLIEAMKQILPRDGEVHTPYGATESLPIVNMTGSEIVGQTWPLTCLGKGTCVGRPLPGIEIRVIAPQAGAVAELEEGMFLAEGEVGEIIVRGDVVTRAYDNNPKENRVSKIVDDAGFWHRMGDMGYLDDQGRLWFCGRKAHRVLSPDGPMYSVCCEAVFNNHPAVKRSALVGLGEPGSQQPVIIIEPQTKITDSQLLFRELREIACRYSHTEKIEKFLIHPSFPVDIRHNAKIFREKLAVWANDEDSAVRD